MVSFFFLVKNFKKVHIRRSVIYNLLFSCIQGFFFVEKRTRLREIGQHNCIFNVNYILALQIL